MEPRVQNLEIDVAVLKASESERNLRLIQGLAELQRVIELLRADINEGDLESQISSARALVRALQAAVTLAKLRSVEDQDRTQNELNIAEKFLSELLQKRATGLLHPKQHIPSASAASTLLLPAAD